MSNPFDAPPVPVEEPLQPLESVEADPPEFRSLEELAQNYTGFLKGAGPIMTQAQIGYQNTLKLEARVEALEARCNLLLEALKSASE